MATASTMSKKRIIFLVLSALLLIFGIYTFNLGRKGPGDIEAYTGKLTLLEGAHDSDFDIKVDSPILIRKVEMYQYVEKEKASNTVREDFYDKHKPEIKITKNEKEYIYKNPKFPSEPKAEIFYGKMKIGDTDLLLSDEILEKFSFDSYINFEKQPKILNVSGLKNGKKTLNLVPIDDYTYSNSVDGVWDVGDLRVTWYTIDPNELAEVYTAVGVVKDGVIGDGDGIVEIYDREISKDEIVSNFSNGNKKLGIGLIAVSSLAVVICLIPLFKKD